MEIADILAGIVVVISIIGAAALLVVVGFVAIVLAIYASVYTIALFHILFVEPVIFDTHSLFTVPYNEIWAMANIYSALVYVLAALYLMGLMEGGKKCT